MNTSRLAACLVGIACAFVTSPGLAADWKLVWADEFSQADGSSPDPAKWSYQVGGHGWGNNELQTYTTRTENARVSGGRLVIEARKEPFTGTDNIAREYTSARLSSLGKFSLGYGRIEASIKLPRGQGIWPAFWMLGADFPTAGWPACGEIDIMENVGRETNIVHGTIHGPGYSGGSGIGKGTTRPGGASLADDFHLYAVEWETNRIRWFVDAQLYFTVTPAQLPEGKRWVFDHPHFLLLNLAVGGNWPGPPDATTTFPQQMIVDYVRVYTRANAPGQSANVLVNPGFENGGLLNWVTYGSGGNTVLATTPALPVHDGANAFKVYGQFSGKENYSGAYQETPCPAGARFTAGGWMLTRSADRINGGNTAWLEVTYRDSSGTALAMFRSGTFSSTDTPDVWRSLRVTNKLNPSTFAVVGTTTNLVAPAGTAVVRFQVVFRQPVNAAGSVLVDDLQLLEPYAVQPPSLNVVRSAEGLQLAFTSEPGVRYEVVCKDDLMLAPWTSLNEVVGNGGLVSISQPISTARRFYRVVAN